MEAKIDHPGTFAVGTAIKFVIGAFFMAIGILLTLDNLDLVYAYPYLHYWPLVLVVIGGIKFAWNSGRAFGIALIVAGLWMIAINEGFIHFTIFDLWPLILIAFGGVLMGRAFGWKPRLAIRTSESTTWAVLTSRNVTVTAPDFTGTDVIAFLGGVRLDLSRASMTRSPAVVDATAIWGGMEILVPDDWEVVGDVVPLLGGFEITAESTAPQRAGQLVVRGVALMGGIEVKSVRRMS